jgi:hypothetical protein
MEINVGAITAVILFLVIMVFQAVEQRRTGAAYRKALADSKARANETVELQRETNRLLTVDRGEDGFIAVNLACHPKLAAEA